MLDNTKNEVFYGVIRWIKYKIYNGGASCKPHIWGPKEISSCIGTTEEEAAMATGLPERCTR